MNSMLVSLFATAALSAFSIEGKAQEKKTGRFLLACGDSLMQLPATYTLPRVLETLSPPVRVLSAVSLGTGLARPDVFDWPVRLREILDREGTPAAAALWFGANDDQPLRLRDGQTALPESPEWAVEYSARARCLLTLLMEAGARPVLWIGLPRMRDAPLQRHAERVNAIGRALCAEFPATVFFDPDPHLRLRSDHYSPYVLDEKGKPVVVRASDGIHLTAAGAQRLSEAIRDALLAAGAFQ